MRLPGSAGLPEYGHLDQGAGVGDTMTEQEGTKQEGPGIPSPSMEQKEVALPEIVSSDAWQAAREDLLTEEKALMKARDSLAAKRRRLPMTPVRNDYRFVGPDGEVNLLGLFAGRRQLIVYRFFYAPDVENWPDGACS